MPAVTLWLAALPSPPAIALIAAQGYFGVVGRQPVFIAGAAPNETWGWVARARLGWLPAEREQVWLRVLGAERPPLARRCSLARAALLGCPIRGMAWGPL